MEYNQARDDFMSAKVECKARAHEYQRLENERAPLHTRLKCGNDVVCTK
jgi:hypothetical protein